ncbi:glycosyltransferase family 2 protein [Butyrivibrio proteoclasticus]|uniref:glycosyltransferase family 2 protein n=1 Tax=Butyrivibrio proteoclasticus TaxID=43305 RepID=UPI0004787E18|nr:glycosyltransferase [Butyrivibrio proteoclasticus]
MHHEPLLSIIMPVRNNERFFPKAVESVLNQSFQDWELIVMEGISTDRTGEIADELAMKDSRIKVIHVGDWIYEKINLGVANSEGKYFTVLNSDDRYEEGTLQSALKYMEMDIDLILLPVVSVNCDHDQKHLSDNKNFVMNKLGDDFVLDNEEDAKANWLEILRSGLLSNQCNIYKKECVEDIRFRNDVYGGDYLFNLRMLPRMKTVAYSKDSVYVFYIYEPEEGMNTSVGKFYDYTDKMFDDFYYEGLNMFAMNNALTEKVIGYLVDARIQDMISTMGTYNYQSCPLSLEEKLKRVFKMVGDKKDLIVRAGLWEKMQDVTIEFCKNIMIGMEFADAGDMEAIKRGILELLDAKNKDKSQVDIDAIAMMVLDYNNPGHIGAEACAKLME